MNDNYESFRDSVILGMREHGFRDLDIDVIESIIGEVAQSYNIERKNVSLIVYNGMPEHVKMFIASKAVEGKSKGTLKNYILALQHMFQGIGKPIDQITANDLRVYMYHYQTARNVKGSTMESMRHCFNSFFSWCLGEGYIQSNPMSKIKAFSVLESTRCHMSLLDLELIREACETTREKAIVDFLFSTGCRVAELCNVKMNDVDLANRTVHIENGKGVKARFTYLNAESVVSLRAYIRERKFDGEYLFEPIRRRSDRPLSNKSIEAEIKKILNRVQDKLSVHVTPHVFRHTAATVALRNGMPIEQVKDFMGHANMNTTMIYARVDNRDVQRSHEKHLG